MTPEMEAAAFDGLADNPAAQLYAEGRADDETRERLIEARDRALANDGRRDAGLLAFIVRDLMDAAAYPYTPDRPLTEQARECCQEIHDGWEKRRELDRLLVQAHDRHDAEVQRLTDLVDELRKQLAGADRHAAPLQDRALEAESLTRELSADLVAERQRTADLDQLLQQRDALSDLDQQIRTAVDDMSGKDPDGDVLFDIVRAILAYARGLDTRMPMIADGIRRTIAMELGLNTAETTPERASTGLTGDSEGSDTGDPGIDALQAAIRTTGISVQDIDPIALREALVATSGPPWGQGRGAYLAGLLGAKFREDRAASGGQP